MTWEPQHRQPNRKLEVAIKEGRTYALNKGTVPNSLAVAKQCRVTIDQESTKCVATDADHEISRHAHCANCEHRLHCL